MRRYQRIAPPASQIIIYLIYLQIGISATWMIMKSLSPHYSLLYLQHFFGLTLVGIKNFFLWQYITYFLTEPISTQFIIGDAFLFAIKLYMFWIAGTIIAERRSSKSFLFFYATTGILGGVATALAILYWSIPFLFVSSFGVIIGMFIAAMMLSPDAKIYLLNVFPVQLKTIVIVIFIYSLMRSLSDGNTPYTINIITTAIVSYLYTIFFWKSRGPFSHLHAFEEWLQSWRKKR